MTYTLNIDNEIGDKIVLEWLKFHMDAAQDSIDHAAFDADRHEAETDLYAMRRVYEYIAGGLDN